MREFLDLMEGAGTLFQREKALPVLLDRLALAQHDITFEPDDAEYPDPPDRDYKSMYDRVSGLFPNYGYYNEVDPVTTSIGATTPLTGDAVDDLADIALDLLEADWRWENNSEADALWLLADARKSHWMTHLRDLQHYLAALDSEK